MYFSPRLPTALLLTALLSVGVGVVSAAKDKEKPTPRDIPMEERHMVEIGGHFYPVYEYGVEVEPEHDPKPRLPRKAKKEARGGTVLLGVLVGENGVVQDAAVAVSNAEADIEKAAKDAVARWLFPVHYHDGKPIAYVVMVPVRFDATPHFGPQ